MSTAEDSSRTPTDAQQQRFREQGRVVVSEDLSIALSTLGSAVVVFWCASDGLSQLRKGFQLWSSPALRGDQLDLTEIGNGLMSIGVWLLPWLVAFALIAGSTRWAQVGLVFVPGNVRPRLRRIDPRRRAAQIFSVAHLARWLRSLMTLLVLGTIAFQCLRGETQRLVVLAHHPIELLPSTAVRICMKLVVALSVGMVAVGLVDYVILRRLFEYSLRMDSDSDRRHVHGVSNDLSAHQRRTARRSSSAG
jgi:flagellar biosynthetic protein FlhB